MKLNKKKLRRPSPSALFPPTIEGFLAVDGGLRISPNSLKTWWPGTELNRRRQPFQCSRPELSVDSARLSTTSLPDFVVFIGAKMEPSWTNLSLPRFASISTRPQVAPAVRTLQEKSKSELGNAHGLDWRGESKNAGCLPVRQHRRLLIKSCCTSAGQLMTITI
jgi:hypothetical protein